VLEERRGKERKGEERGEEQRGGEKSKLHPQYNPQSPNNP
jgi:hypothetical protein